MSDSDDWVVDRGLLVLRAQVDAAAPNRSKASDGTIGDPAHQARTSDHNPQDTADSSDGNDPNRQVDALDLTHDPAHGADMAVVSEAIRASRDQRVQYLIFNRRIAYPTSRNGYPAWAWQPYSGDDPHTNHLHVSVNDTHNDETQRWEIGIDMAITDADLARIKKAIWEEYNAGSSKNPARPIDRLNLAAGVGVTLAPRLDAILAAALDDGNTTVVLDPSALAELQALRADLAGLPAEVADAVNDDAAARMES